MISNVPMDMNNITKIKKVLENIVGKVCEVLIPIKHEYCIGRRGTSIAICTLASIRMLEDICKSEMMDKILVAGRLFSENKGIDTIVKFTLTHPELHYIILCGKEAKGHQAGQALISLHKYGVNVNNINNNNGSRIIIGAKGHLPILRSSQEDIDTFRKQIIKIYDLIGIDDIEKIRKQLKRVYY